MRVQQIEYLNELTNKTVKAKIKHNLEEHGTSLHAALVNWVYRTDTFKLADFVTYVLSKDPINLKCKIVK